MLESPPGKAINMGFKTSSRDTLIKIPEGHSHFPIIIRGSFVLHCLQNGAIMRKIMVLQPIVLANLLDFGASVLPTHVLTRQHFGLVALNKSIAFCLHSRGIVQQKSIQFV